MHLAYMDDSGSDPKSPIVVFGGVIVRDVDFLAIESDVGSVVERLIPADLQDKFEEFHASQLYLGLEVFKPIKEEDRYDAIERLLHILKKFKIPFIYSAVSRERLMQGPFASAIPVDVAFRLCALGVEKWLEAREGQRGEFWDELCLFILDDTEDKTLKNSLKRSFCRLRLRLRDSQMGLTQERLKKHRLWHLHDDMYFGDSKDSVGLQIADLCAYFMMRKLRGEDDGMFFDLLKSHAICAEPEPEYSQCAQLLLRHDD